MKVSDFDYELPPERIYEELREAGVDVCLDDRRLRPGPKFKDLELLGFPYTVTVGRGAPEGKVEFSIRRVNCSPKGRPTVTPRPITTAWEPLIGTS